MPKKPFKRTFGVIEYIHRKQEWLIKEAEPHVWISLKANFEGIPLSATSATFPDNPQVCHKLLWFFMLYPFVISKQDQNRLISGKNQYTRHMRELEKIMLPSYKPKMVALNPGYKPRVYQLAGNDFFLRAKRLLLADEFGLGKTLSAILAMTDKKCLPAVVVCQTHLAYQWEKEIRKFTNLTPHIIDGTKPYNLPACDVYIVRYSVVAKWINVLTKIGLKYAVFDEVQECRRKESAKYEACKKLSQSVDMVQGLSATPIFNYGEEIWNIMDCIKPGCLGTNAAFVREWVKNTYVGNNRKSRPVKDPQALGSYLREIGVFLRRTREEVGQQLPPFNNLVFNVDYDKEAVKREENIMRSLAQRVVSGDREDRFTASGEFDMQMRKLTGVSKAKFVAAFVKMMVDQGETVLLAGWHHEVYDIWEKEFDGYDPVWYTGQQTSKQKHHAATNFADGNSKIMIMSLRSGAGVDGLQNKCSMVIFGELDWSPQIHAQFRARIDRPGQERTVTSIFLNSEYGSDPAIIRVLGVKASQSHGIIDPFKAPVAAESDDARVVNLAKEFLNKLEAA